VKLASDRRHSTIVTELRRCECGVEIVQQQGDRPIGGWGIVDGHAVEQSLGGVGVEVQGIVHE